MPILLGALALVALGAGAYKLTKGSRGYTGTGEIFAIGLFGLPPEATVNEVGLSLAYAMSWRTSTISDAVLTGNILQFGFKSGVQTPPLPGIGFQFQVLGKPVTVLYVVTQPASTTVFS